MQGKQTPGSLGGRSAGPAMQPSQGLTRMDGGMAPSVGAACVHHPRSGAKSGLKDGLSHSVVPETGAIWGQKTPLPTLVLRAWASSVTPREALSR